MAVALNPKQFAARLAAGAPLAKGVRGRTEALMNMDRHARFAAEAKTTLRAGAAKGRSNLVNRYSSAVTGSTGKQRKFGRS